MHIVYCCSISQPDNTMTKHFWSVGEKQSRAVTRAAIPKFAAIHMTKTYLIFFSFSSTSIWQLSTCFEHVLQDHTSKGTRETQCNLQLTDSCSSCSNVCHARPPCGNSQVGNDLPGTATAAAPAEATSVGAPWVDLARLALLGRCSSPRC